MKNTLGVSINFFGPGYIEGGSFDETFEKFLEPIVIINNKEQVKKRYLEIINKDNHSFFAPSDKNISEKICIPLKNAIIYYAIGHALSSIALSGIVCEMLCSLLWESQRDNELTRFLKKNEKIILGKDFNKLDQVKKINILRIVSIISEEEKDKLHKVKDVRNKYIHSFNYSHLEINKDAKNSCLYAMSLFKSMLGIGISNQPGQITIKKEILDYTNKQ